MRFLHSAVLTSLLALLPLPVFAVDISQPAFSEIDNSNSTGLQPTFPEGMLPSAVNDNARALQGAIKRWYDHANATVVSAGSTNTQTLTYPVAPALATGDVFRFIVGPSNTGAATLNINGLGAKTIQNNGAPLVGGELVSGAVAEVTYDGTNFQIHRFSVANSHTVDPRDYGAKCNSSTDATAGIQAAADSLSSGGGGTIVITCPLTVGGTVTLGGATRMTGITPMTYPGMSFVPGPSIWPPTSGAAINCTGLSNPCVMANGVADEIDHLNFGNPQPAPVSMNGTTTNGLNTVTVASTAGLSTGMTVAATGVPLASTIASINSGVQFTLTQPATASGTTTVYLWKPTVYPFVIATSPTSGWQGLNLHDDSFTSTSNAIDLEGTTDYATYSGNEIRLQHIWCNACLNTGIKFHNIDNATLVSHVDFVPQWYNDNPAMGAYERNHLIGFDIQYLAAPQFDNLNFFATKSAIQLSNGTVTNNLVLHFAASAVQMTNVMFNQVCQAITAPNGNGVVAGLTLTNVFVWGDESGFRCATGKAMFDLPTNDINLSMSQVGVEYVDTFANVGCGLGCSPSGAAILRMNDVDVREYSHFSISQPFIKAPAGTYVSFGTSNISAIRPNASAGKIMGIGQDNTQGYMSPITVGGGTKSLEGAVQLQGSANTVNTGYVGFYTPNNLRRGFVGFGDGTIGLRALSDASTNGSGAFGNERNPVIIGIDNTNKQIVTFTNLPTSCSGLPIGTLWDSGGSLRVC